MRGGGRRTVYRYERAPSCLLSPLESRPDVLCAPRTELPPPPVGLSCGVAVRKEESAAASNLCVSEGAAADSPRALSTMSSASGGSVVRGADLLRGVGCGLAAPARPLLAPRGFVGFPLGGFGSFGFSGAGMSSGANAPGLQPTRPASSRLSVSMPLRIRLTSTALSFQLISCSRLRLSSPGPSMFLIRKMCAQSSLVGCETRTSCESHA